MYTEIKFFTLLFVYELNVEFFLILFTNCLLFKKKKFLHFMVTHFMSVLILIHVAPSSVDFQHSKTMKVG